MVIAVHNFIMIFINFKTYGDLTGSNALSRAKLCEEVSKATQVPIIIAPQATDIFRLATQVSIAVFGQHCDEIEPGRNTGCLSALSFKEAGAKGIMLNHSEHPFVDFDSLFKAHDSVKKAGLETLIFVRDIQTAHKVDLWQPTFIALEEPELIAKTAMVNFPELKQKIAEFSRSIKTIPILGAGIKTKEDIIESLKLGVRGVVFASEFAFNPNQKQLLTDFASCFQ